MPSSFRGVVFDRKSIARRSFIDGIDGDRFPRSGTIASFASRRRISDDLDRGSSTASERCAKSSKRATSIELAALDLFDLSQSRRESVFEALERGAVVRPLRGRFVVLVPRDP